MNLPASKSSLTKAGSKRISKKSVVILCAVCMKTARIMRTVEGKRECSEVTKFNRERQSQEN